MFSKFRNKEKNLVQPIEKEDKKEDKNQKKEEISLDFTEEELSALKELPPIPKEGITGTFKLRMNFGDIANDYQISHLINFFKLPTERKNELIKEKYNKKETTWCLGEPGQFMVTAFNVMSNDKRSIERNYVKDCIQFIVNYTSEVDTGFNDIEGYFTIDNLDVPRRIRYHINEELRLTETEIPIK